MDQARHEGALGAQDPQALIDALGMRASWIAPEGAAGPGAWLVRCDIDLLPLLQDRTDGVELVLESAHVVVASTGDVAALLDSEPIGDVRYLGPTVAATLVADVTDAVLAAYASAGGLALALRVVDDRALAPHRAAPAVLAALVLRARGAAGGASRTLVVGSDASWLVADAGIVFELREDPARRPREVHALPDAWADEDAVEKDWTAFGAMHTDAHRTWRPAVEAGRHPSLVHPRLEVPPRLVAEELVPVRERILAPGGVQCLDLGQTVRCRPELALPEGARRPVTVWAGAVPGTPPHGGDLRLVTHGRAGVLEAHGTTSGRYLHIHGAPDIEELDIVLPVRTGVLPRVFETDLSDDRLSLLLSDGLASLGARCQERYTGEDAAPLLADIARTARTALWLGGDTWRSARALEAYLDTARRADVGTVVDVIAPDGPRADLDEHTFALPGWIADHAGAAPAPRRAGAVVGGIAERLLHRIARGPSPAGRMDTLVAALDALDAFERLARRAGAPEEERGRYARAAADLRAEGRASLRAHRTTGGSARYHAARGDRDSSSRATAGAILAGLVEPHELAVTRATLRHALEESALDDPTGAIRAALVRAGDGTAVLAAHGDGDDVPPLLLSEVVSAVSGVRIDGDRVHVRTPLLPIEGLDLELPHQRGTVRIRWDGATGEVDLPVGCHALVLPDGASSPVWYNNGTTALRRPAPRR